MESLTLKPNQVIELLTSLYPTRQPVYLHGPPGVGKSSVVKTVTEKLGIDNRVLIGSQIEGVDVRGLPILNGKRTEWAVPSFLPTDGQGILFLDELPQSQPDVQKAFMQLILDRRLGDYVLPEGWVTIAAGNRVQDRAGASRVLSALNNRFSCHIDVEPCSEDWDRWAAEAGIIPEVRAFIKLKPHLLFAFKPELNERSFPTPRSWHKLSAIYRATPPSLRQAVAAGAVGQGAAVEFGAFVRLYEKLPDVDNVIANPTTSPIPKEVDVLHTLIIAMADRVRKDKTKVGNFAKYGMRLPDEFALLALREACGIDRRILADPAAQKWIEKGRKAGYFSN